MPDAPLTHFWGPSMSPVPLKFGHKLYLARRSRGLSLPQAAQVCGLSADSWERWETGANEPMAGALVSILYGLKLPADYFEPADFKEVAP